MLADRSARGLSPLGWAARVAETVREVNAQRVVAEVNQGGDMVRSVLAAAGCPVAIRPVHASRSKRARAAPVAALYEQGRVVHTAAFPALEEEMMAFGVAEGAGSPDRVDALVWAVTDLMLGREAAPRLRALRPEHAAAVAPRRPGDPHDPHPRLVRRAAVARACAGPDPTASETEAKSSPTRRLIALTGGGQARWTPLDYAALAKEGYAGNPVVHRCVRMIAEASASLPLVVHAADGARAGPDHPLQRLLDRPNPEDSGPDLMERFFGALQTSGDGYLECAGDPDAPPSELYALRPDRVRVVPGRDGWPQGWIYTVDGREALLARAADGSAPVLHLKLYNPLDDVYGLSPLQAAAKAVDVHNASSAWNKALLDNSARPSGALVYGSASGERMTEEQFDRLKAELADQHSGALAARAAPAAGGRTRLEAHGADARGARLRRGQARGRARDRPGVRRAAAAPGRTGRQHLLQLQGGQRRLLALGGRAAGAARSPRAHRVARPALRWRDGRRGLGRRSRACRRAHRPVDAAGRLPLHHRRRAAAHGGPAAHARPRRRAGRGVVSDLGPPPSWRIDRQVTPAVILALMIQTGAALLWAGGAAERIAAVERRMDRQSGVNERLARLEAQADANRLSLDRIEAKLDRSTR